VGSVRGATVSLKGAVAAMVCRLHVVQVSAMLLIVAGIDNGHVTINDGNWIDGAFRGLIYRVMNSGVSMQTYPWTCGGGNPHCLEFAAWDAWKCQWWSIEPFGGDSPNDYAIRAPFCDDGKLYLQTYAWTDHGSTSCAETQSYDSPRLGQQMSFLRMDGTSGEVFGAFQIQAHVNWKLLTSYPWVDHGSVHAGEFVAPGGSPAITLELVRDLYELKSTILSFSYVEPSWGDIDRVKTFMGSRELRNCASGSAVTNTVTFGSTQKSSNTMTFSEKTTLGGGVKTTIEENAGVPLIASAKLTDEFSFTWSHESSKSTTTTIEVDEEITFSQQVTVEQQHCVLVSGYFYFVKSGTYSVPFTARVKLSVYGPMGDGGHDYVSNADAIVHIFQKEGMTATVVDHLSETEVVVEVEGTMTAATGIDSFLSTENCGCLDDVTV